MPRTRRAPAVIAGLYVLQYAHTHSIRFKQRHTLNVNGKWLGRVPCLALCQPFDKAEFMIQHCSAKWETLGVAAGYTTAQRARASIERSYHGITGKWRKQTVSKRKASAIYRAELQEQSCSFCRRTPLEVTSMVGRKTLICNYCVDSFHEAIHETT